MGVGVFGVGVRGALARVAASVGDCFCAHVAGAFGVFGHVFKLGELILKLS